MGGTSNVPNVVEVEGKKEDEKREKENKKNSFAVVHGFCSWCDPLLASTYKCD